MDDEIQDPELDCVRECWDAPAPGPDFHGRVMEACQVKPPWWKRWIAVRVPLPVASAAVLAAFLLAWFLRAPTPAKSTMYRYELVSQPRFIVVSQGEHP